MTEDQKYQGALYKPKRQKPNQTETQSNRDTMAHRAYVEDVAEEYEEYQDYEVRESGEEGSHWYTGMPPAAPMPPPAVADDANVNVFDYLLEATPNASKVNFQSQQTPTGYGGGGRQLIRFGHDESNYVDESGYMVDDGAMGQYGTAYETPAPKAHRKKTKDAERELKKDKKRKRLHIETSPGALQPRTDEVMTDAPPVLHSGLTGGLNRMMRPSQFPPSPDYSGGDAGEVSPAGSIKKKKQSKPSRARRTDSIGSNLKALVSGTSKSKVSKKRKHSSERKDKKRRTHSHSSSQKTAKLIEYRAKSGDEQGGESGALIVYRPRSDLFLSLCNKGPESERGCSVNKALKRYHRERSSSGTSLGKPIEEKELWRSLRMRRNERGEIVLFSLEEGQ